MVDTLVKLETSDGQHVGWTRVRQRFQLWPDVLVWGDRLFRFASSSDDSYRLYLEATVFAVVTPVTAEPPPPPGDAA